ncbi:hypothetical protein [Nocardioides humi]|uniref:GIY-YIG domain-containing protein n=1 Tax=Nocardioides humi TaxID=449461 RepID=A0ABN2ALD8_9ACTN|nr:hypothetical protein [Nocardioides humi]
MIRLGSLAGYSFEGPRVLAGWTPPAVPAVYAVFYPTDPGTERLAVCYVGHSADLSTEGFPFRHPAAACWISRTSSRFDLRIATFEVPGGTAAHREQIVQELVAVYHPSCNEQQYDQAWEPHWIGEYQAPNTTGPLTTGLTPGQGRRETGDGSSGTGGSGA